MRHVSKSGQCSEMNRRVWSIARKLSNGTWYTEKNLTFIELIALWTGLVEEGFGEDEIRVLRDGVNHECKLLGYSFS